MADYEKIGRECWALHTATPVDPTTDAALHFAGLMYPGAYRPAASPGGGGRVDGGETVESLRAERDAALARLRTLELDALGRRGHDVATPQPAPVAGTGDVWAEVIADETHPILRHLFQARRSFGLEKYGTPLQRENRRNHRADLLQELGDAVVYARAAGEREVEAICRTAVLKMVAKDEIAAWERDVTDGAPVLPGAECDDVWRLRNEVHRWRGRAEAQAETIAALQSTPAAMPDGPGILRRWPMPGCAPAGRWISHGPDDHLEARADFVAGPLIGRWHDPGDGSYPVFVEEGRRMGEVPEDESHRHDSLMGEWFELVDEATVVPGASASPDDDAYIILDGDGGIEWADTEDEALGIADRILGSYRDEAESDGEWSDDVEGVTIARVIARAVVVRRDLTEDGEVDAVEYGMRRVEVSDA